MMHVELDIPTRTTAIQFTGDNIKAVRTFCENMAVDVADYFDEQVKMAVRNSWGLQRMDLNDYVIKVERDYVVIPWTDFSEWYVKIGMTGDRIGSILIKLKNH